MGIKPLKIEPGLLPNALLPAWFLYAMFVLDMADESGLR